MRVLIIAIAAMSAACSSIPAPETVAEAPATGDSVPTPAPEPVAKIVKPKRMPLAEAREAFTAFMAKRKPDFSQC